MRGSNSMWRPVLALAALLAATFWAAPAARAGTPTRVEKASATAIAGGLYEASGVVRVPGASGALFVDDGTTDAVFWIDLDASGRQTGRAARVALGASVTDMEDITTDGTYVYVVGSQSKKSSSGAGLVRFKFDAASRSISGLEKIDDLEEVLLSGSSELARAAGKSGVNVEGLAWDAARNRLLLGLRGPVDGGDALVVPVEFAGTFAGKNLRVGPVVRLDLGGMGVRGLEYDPSSRAFLLIAGASDKATRVDFTLWSWSGDGSAPALARITTIDRDLKPEGVTRIDGGRLLVVCDVGSYLTIEQ